MANFPPGSFGNFPGGAPGSGQVLGQTSGKPLYLCHPFVRSALIKGSFKTIVVLPKYVDQREWVAVNRESQSACIFTEIIEDDR